MVGKNVFSEWGRVREGEFVVVHRTMPPKQGDEVLVRHKGDKGQSYWSLERFVTTFDGQHLFHDPASTTKAIKDFVEWCLVVAYNPPQSVIRPPERNNHKVQRNVSDVSKK